MPGMDIRKGDKVRVIAGKDRSAEGRVIQAFPKAEKVLVEGVNRIKKHTKITSTQRGAQSGGIVTQEAAIDVSNVQVVCGSCDKPTRIGHRTDDDGRSRRVCKRCGADL
jgi:large subunit ribosomal protein L24